MNKLSNQRDSLSFSICAIAVSVVVLISIAGAFARIQSVWVDETTQLSGLALGGREQLRWLLGKSELNLGVPLDRMPPLSYWLGGLWARIFGTSEMAMRWFGIFAVAMAAPALYFAGRQAAGAVGGCFCLGFVLFSPNVIVQAVEIRPYPMFFAFCAWGTWCFSKLVIYEDTDKIPVRRSREAWRPLLLLSGFTIAAVYTHFYGLLFGFCVFASVFVDRCLRRAPLLPVLGVGILTAALSVGVIPFALAAIDLSGSGINVPDIEMPAGSLADTARDVAKLAFRTVAHGSQIVYVTIGGLLALGTVGLACIVLLSSRHKTSWVQRFVVGAPLLLAFLILASMSGFVRSFSVLAPHYNIWMVPVLSLWLSFALDTYTFLLRRIAFSFSVLAIAGQLGGSGMLIKYGRYFTHGPGEWVTSNIVDPLNTLILHDGSGPWGFVYYPVHFLGNGQVTQILVEPGMTPQLISGFKIHQDEMNLQKLMKDFETVLYVSTRQRDTQFLAEHIRAEKSCGGAPLPVEFRRASAVKHLRYCAYTAASMFLLRSF